MPTRAPTHKPFPRNTRRHQPLDAPETWGSGRGGRPWRRKRKQIFERDKYLCQECARNGKLTGVMLEGPRAGICDHIVPKAEGGTDDEDNLQTLCKRCSDAKTAREAGRALQRAGLPNGSVLHQHGAPPPAAPTGAVHRDGALPREGGGRVKSSGLYGGHRAPKRKFARSKLDFEN